MDRIILTASEGMILTDGTIYGKMIYLGIGKKAEDFYEITEEEYENLMEGDEASGYNTEN